MDFVIVVLVLVAALVALAYPLYRAQTQGSGLDASTLDDVLAQRDGVYATLRDLELDKELGKLDAADYDALREKYMTRATEILQTLDALRGEGSGQQASAEIEREVAAMRKGTTDRKSPTVKETEPPKLEPGNADKREASDLFCTNCGRKYKLGDQFCARCGRALG